MFKLLKRDRKAKHADELRRLIGGADLPSFPAVVMEALGKVRNDDTSSREIAGTLAVDPGLTVKLLSTANSSAYALRHPVKDLQHAVAVLGRSELELILISMAVGKALPQDRAPGYVAGRFWAAAARRAVTARALATRLAPSLESQSFTAALLQDMAIPLLAHRRENEYGPVLERWQSGEPDLAVLERDHFGWDHARVGTLMAAEWDFPPQLAEAIAAHHGSGTTGEAELPPVSLVASLGEGGDLADVERLIDQASDRFGVTPEDTREIVGSAFAEATDIAKFFA